MANTTKLTAFASCACGLKGELTRTSPGILNGGNSRHSTWTLQSDNNPTRHEGRSDWCDECRRFETTCLTTERKTGCQ